MKRRTQPALSAAPSTGSEPPDAAVEAGRNRPGAPSRYLAEHDAITCTFNARIVKFSTDGKFISAFATKGSAAGELMSPHGLAMDSRGRLFVADRTNNRIQIFDQNGQSLATWKQFGRPSGIFIDKRDVLYVADSESTDREYAWSGPWAILAKGYGYNPGFRRGIRVGSARDGSVVAFIPEPYSPTGTPNDPTSGAEGVAADSTGAIYGAEVREQDIKKYVRSAR